MSEKGGDRLGDTLANWVVILFFVAAVVNGARAKYYENAATVDWYLHYAYRLSLAGVGIGVVWLYFRWMNNRRKQGGPYFDDHGRPLKVWPEYYNSLKVLPRAKRRRKHLWTAITPFGTLPALLAAFIPLSLDYQAVITLVFFIGGFCAGCCIFYQNGKENLFPAEELELVNNPPVKLVYDTPPPRPSLDVRVVVDFPEPPPEPPPPPAGPAEDFGFSARMSDELMAAVVGSEYPLPPHHVFELVLSVGEQLFAAPRQLPEKLQHPRPLWPEEDRKEWDALKQEWLKADERIFQAVAKSLTAYLSKLPRFEPAPFRRPLQPTGSAIFDMVPPLRALREYGLHQEAVRQFDINTAEYSKTVKGATDAVYPQNFQGPADELASTYLWATPFMPLFDVLVPYNPFTDEMRFTHHWCMGDNGSGKTTFLRHLIRHDMDRAASGGCSLVVMDSKGLPKQQHPLLRRRRSLDHRRDKQQSLAHTQARAARDRAVGESHYAYRGDAHPLYRSRLRRSEDTRRRR